MITATMNGGSSLKAARTQFLTWRLTMNCVQTPQCNLNVWKRTVDWFGQTYLAWIAAANQNILGRQRPAMKGSLKVFGIPPFKIGILGEYIFFIVHISKTYIRSVVHIVFSNFSITWVWRLNLVNQYFFFWKSNILWFDEFFLGNFKRYI